jgi:PIN domain nuclease of toxin-antitoxin system
VARGRLRLLLDSHVLLWLYGDPRALPPRILREIKAEENEKVVSAATVWEAAIKREGGRLAIPGDLAGLVRTSGFSELPIRFEHAVAAAELPRLHGDPFDRMLVAQARVEGLTLITADRQIRRYDVRVLPAG